MVMFNVGVILQLFKKFGYILLSKNLAGLIEKLRNFMVLNRKYFTNQNARD